MFRHLRRPFVAGLAATLAVAALLVAPASPAYAHNVLRKATPAQDAELDTAPKKVTLEFMQKLNPKFTTITLSDADKQPVATSEPEVSGTKGTITIDGTLDNGVYTVAYRVVSLDGHPVQGSYTFTVADPTATAAPSPSASPQPSEPAETTPAAPTTAPTSAAAASPAAGESSGGSGLLVALLAGGLVLVALAVGAIFLRRRGSAGSPS
ncbi:copper resistance protein CopC [Micromonospora sp. FIMYZ51]|uniref:copper resistance CopC family protein n=1 Tax=Micromonospora sp. FIMYZ51 TaxID=3051832 RepID=UPI00311D34A8